MKLKIEGRPVYLNHYPFLCYGGVYREPQDQVWALHGHIHLGPNSLEGKDVPRMEYLYPTQYDVGVDMNNYTPISWKEVKEKIEYQVENNVNCMYWTKL
jgi:calcineurin-like phosphoesterase family protein